jgi:hypothetical protein
VVVADGYGYNLSTLYHHINLGWGGNDNAWYNLPTIDTSLHTYSSVDGCGYNLFTSGTGEIISGRVLDKGGNPIPGADVIAKRSPTTWTTTTNSKGIYALKNLPSSQTYSIDAQKTGHAFSSKSISTGRSTDGNRYSGNVWGIDFLSSSDTPPIAYDQSVNALTGVATTITLQAGDEGDPNNPDYKLLYIITELPAHGRLADPSAGPIDTVPYILQNDPNQVIYTSCSYFAGQDQFSFVADDGGTAPAGGWSNTAYVNVTLIDEVSNTWQPNTSQTYNLPLYSSFHDCRAQMIYHADNIGPAQTLTEIGFNLNNSPGQNLNNFTIRMQHTSMAYYTYPDLIAGGWTTVYQGTMTATPTGWRMFPLQTPFTYNGTDNLLVDISFDNTYATTNGYNFVSDTGQTRLFIALSDSHLGPPTLWGPGEYNAYLFTSWLPNMRFAGNLSSTPMTGDFNVNCAVDGPDLMILCNAWLTGLGDETYNADCDISSPKDNQINIADLAVLAGTWLISTL